MSPVQKYPTQETPYRYRRRKPHPCCTSRTGRPKVLYPDEAAAKAALEPGQKAYPCQPHEGRWHVKTKRAHS